ncbi:MAG: DNA-directed RNA polymerase subunit alpha [Victivallaceae bacterium]|nr:DNA-directed RNA polymerase subunit alpha [Victivallaceae bacterium]
MTAAIGFPMPKSIELDETTATATYGKFTASPFQSGFGQTLGNSLRRVLLSSLEGAAICAVRIDGCTHEFASLDHVVEDVAEIVLNLKRVRLSCFAEGIKTLEVKKSKAGVVTAGDIVVDSTTEVLNPDQVICTLDKDIPFRAEVDIMRGCGYLPAEKSALPHNIGTILIDALFSPVVAVNYTVGLARVGEETEMDSLELEIKTDGSISPKDALETAAKILRDHLQPFLGGQVVEKDVIAKMNDEDVKLFKLLSQDVDVLDLSVRAMNCLNSANIRLLGELCIKTESKMLKYRNFGKKSLDEIKEKIEKFGLTLGMNLSDTLLEALEAESARIRAEQDEEAK